MSEQNRKKRDSFIDENEDESNLQQKDKSKQCKPKSFFNDESIIQIFIEALKPISQDQIIAPRILDDECEEDKQDQGKKQKDLCRNMKKNQLVLFNTSTIQINLNSENQSSFEKNAFSQSKTCPVFIQLNSSNKAFQNFGIQTCEDLLDIGQQKLSEKQITAQNIANDCQIQNKHYTNTPIQQKPILFFQGLNQNSNCTNSVKQISQKKDQKAFEGYKITMLTNTDRQANEVKSQHFDQIDKSKNKIEAFSIKAESLIKQVDTKQKQLNPKIIDQQQLKISYKKPQQIEKILKLGLVQQIQESEYDNIIKQLNQKIFLLEEQYQKLKQQSKNSQPSSQIFLTKQQNLSLLKQAASCSQFERNFQIANSHSITVYHSLINQYVNQKSSNQIIREKNTFSQKQTPHQSRDLANQQQMQSSSTQNLLTQLDSELNGLQSLKGQNLPKQDLMQTSVVYQTKTISFSILLISQSNLMTIKKPGQQLPTQKFRNIMKLDHLVSKISFKQKHYPSNYSTQQEIKLYGKRLIRLLAEYQNRSARKFNENSTMTLQNDLQYDKTGQQVIYYLKNNKNFIILCYFNHTIYIGEYIIHGRFEQIVRQGYGIQIRESKYIYQGQFSADKKHGYGFVQFIGKNPFIYCGYFLDGFMDGLGKSMNQNDQVYIGDYKLGQRDGIGKLFYNLKNQAYYHGEFYDGYKHGKGIQVFENGDSYSGHYVKDKFQGIGQYKWKNETVYRGTFVEGSKHGKGLLILANGKTFEKYYDHNKSINLQDDKKTVKSSRVSITTQSKHEEKTLIQEKPRNFRKAHSTPGQSVFSHNSISKQKQIKISKQKKKIADLLRQKELQQDLSNLDKILKDPSDENKVKKIFSVKKIDIKNKIMGKMYNTAERPSIKLGQAGNRELDLLKLSKIGYQKKSLININSLDQLQLMKNSFEDREGGHNQQITNFSQF